MAIPALISVAGFTRGAESTSVAGATTGGGSATPMQVTTFAKLKAIAQDEAARVRVVSGSITSTKGDGDKFDRAALRRLRRQTVSTTGRGSGTAV